MDCPSALSVAPPPADSADDGGEPDGDALLDLALALLGGDATSAGGLRKLYEGPRPPQYQPMKKEARVTDVTHATCVT